MEYKKINNGNYVLQIINTNRFKSIQVNVCCTKEFNKADICYENLICKMLTSTSKKYNTFSKMNIKAEELYQPFLNSSFSRMGQLSSTKFLLEFINPKYTEESMLEETFDYLGECLFNPHIEDESFNKEVFDASKEKLLSYLDSIKENPSILSDIKFKSIMYEGTPDSYSIFGDEAEFNKITSEDLYNYYENYFDTHKINIVILGNIEDEDNLIKIVNGVFKNIGKKEYKLNIFSEPRKIYKFKEFSEKMNFNQSQLYMGYRIKDITEYERRIILPLYNNILGVMDNNILFSKLRMDNSLCYQVNSYFGIYNLAIIVNAGINSKNYTKAIDLVKKSINLMSDIKNVKPLFEVAIKAANTILNDFYDNSDAILGHYYIKEFDNGISSVEEKRELLLNAKVEDIVEFSKKVYLSTIYFFEGSKEE